MDKMLDVSFHSLRGCRSFDRYADHPNRQSEKTESWSSPIVWAILYSLPRPPTVAFATPTPATDGERVYAWFYDGSFAALSQVALVFSVEPVVDATVRGRE
jgi:hypothetical protein